MLGIIATHWIIPLVGSNEIARLLVDDPNKSQRKVAQQWEVSHTWTEFWEMKDNIYGGLSGSKNGMRATISREKNSTQLPQKDYSRSLLHAQHSLHLLPRYSSSESNSWDPADLCLDNDLQPLLGMSGQFKSNTYSHCALWILCRCENLEFCNIEILNVSVSHFEFWSLCVYHHRFRFEWFILSNKLR